jgi:hypothetical protein
MRTMVSTFPQKLRILQSPAPLVVRPSVGAYADPARPAVIVRQCDWCASRKHQNKLTQRLQRKDIMDDRAQRGMAASCSAPALLSRAVRQVLEHALARNAGLSMLAAAIASIAPTTAGMAASDPFASFAAAPAGGDGSAGFVLRGIFPSQSGQSVSAAGDVNGDGIDDVIIGAPYAPPHQAGQTYVVFGRTTGFPAAFELSSLLPDGGGDGSAGFVLNGIPSPLTDTGDQSGFSVSAAGDINGDGLDDVIIGARFAGPNDQSLVGESYVVFGRTTGFPAVIELRSLLPGAGGDGSTGFALKGINSSDHSGTSVSAAGDVSGDGLDDLIIGADGADPHGNLYAGQSYVVFGSTTIFPAAFQLHSLLPDGGGDGSAGFVLNGVNEFTQSGVSVSDAGDVNGDGMDDLIIGAWAADPNGNSGAGESYVVFGRTAGFPAAFELRSLLPPAGGDGSAGFVLKGIDPEDNSGFRVRAAGDVDGDGIDDVIIGAIKADPNGRSLAGETYVVFGRTAGFPAAFELRTLLPGAGGDGSSGFVLKGIDVSDQSGLSVSGAGDINGDGVDDVIIGAPNASPNDRSYAGESYLVFGRTTGFPAAFELRSLLPGAGGDGSSGFVLRGVATSDFSGSSVSAAGDVNGDGVDDLIIGAPYGAGESYVVFGRTTGFPPVFELTSLLPR